MPLPAILVPLVAKGLNLVANAALVKGKEWIKDKTGVDLDQASLSSEDIVKLKTFQMEKEIELLRIQQEDNRLEADLEKAYLADVANARQMQAVALAQEDKFSKRFVYFFTMAWSAFAMVYVMLITFGYIPPENIRFADTIQGFMLGTIMSTMFGYYFGSSRSSAAKNEVVNAAVKQLAKEDK
jgi:hypothetical protein